MTDGWVNHAGTMGLAAVIGLGYVGCALEPTDPIPTFPIEHHGGIGDAPAPSTDATIVRVVDGDTVIVDVAGTRKTVRLLGIDAPESVKPGYTVACWGHQASDYAKAVLPPGLAVTLTGDPLQDSVDKYGRTLAYVKIASPTGDGWDYSIEAARVGMVHDYVFHDHPDAEHAAIVAAENEARTAGKGLWGAPCFGNTPSVPKN